MTFTNTDATTLVSKFKQLPVNDQIAALGQIYTQVAGSVPSTTSKQVEDVVRGVLGMRHEGQIHFLGDALSDTDRDEVALDINPSKAMAELIPGDGVEPPISAYEALTPSDRLLVWSQLARHMGDQFVALPADYQVSDAAKEVLTTLQSAGTEDKVNFLSQIV